MQREGLIAERYRLVERIGAGGMGVVWRATDTELGREVALKRSHEGDGGQIRREGRIGAGLHHPHVVTVFDAVVDHGDRWLVMEYLPSRSLSEIIAQDGPLAQEDAAKVGVQIAAALAAMHERGMVHRDVKPGNVLVAEDGTAKLSDLGIARWAEVTRTGGADVVGTPAYLAPEVANGGEARASSDLFALGATLCAAVEGHSPWGPAEVGPYEQMRRAMAGVPMGLSRPGELTPVLAELLQRDPAARPTARRAKELLEGVSGLTVPIVALPRPCVPVRRRRGVLIGAAALVVVLALGTVLYLKDSSSTKESGVPVAAVSGASGRIVDKHTADPCALLERSSVEGFGTGVVDLDSEYGQFNQCSYVVHMEQGDQKNIRVELELTNPPENPFQPHTPGELGPIQRRLPTADECRRMLPLRDENQVVVTARPQGGNEYQQLCTIAEAVLNAANNKLIAANVPSRKEPFPASSLGNVDACGVLDDGDLAPLLGPGVPPKPDYGDWACYWERNPLDVSVFFLKVWAGEVDEVDQGEQKIPVGSGWAIVNPISDDEDPACSVTVFRSPYQEDLGFNSDWVETATVELASDDEAVTSESLCDRTVVLARSMAGRLPPA